MRTERNRGATAPNLAKLAIIAAAGFLWAGCNASSTDQAAVAHDRQEIERLRQENQDLTKLRQENEEVQRLRKENQELPKLRGQYQELVRLRKENEQLRNQLTKAPSATNRTR